LQKSIEKLLLEEKNLVVLEVDAEKFSGLVQKSEFNVRSVPALFLFQSGEMTKKVSGSMNFQQLKEFIEF
jgi:thioredoxin-like negative regulator of GroEL